MINPVIVVLSVTITVVLCIGLLILNYEYALWSKIPAPSDLTKKLEKLAKRRSRKIKARFMFLMKHSVQSEYSMRAEDNDDLAIKFIEDDFRKSNWDFKIDDRWILLREIKNSENQTQEPKKRIYR